MNLMDMSLAEASAAAIAIVASQRGVRVVASPEMARLSQNEQVRLLLDGAELLLLAAKGLEARSSARPSST